MKYIGDVVLTTPIIRAVREKYPDAYLAYLGDSKAVSLLEGNPFLNEIIPFDFSKPTLFEQPKVALKLRRRKFDAVVDLFSNPRSALLSYLSGAPVRIGKQVKGRGKLYTHPIQGEMPRSAIAFHYEYVKPLGIEPRHWRTEIFLSDDEQREAQRFLKWQNVDLDKPIIAIHPGATWPNKMWLKERFAELIDLMIAKLRVEVVLSLGPEDNELGRFISEQCIGNVHALPVLPLRQLAGILSQCRLMVTNDCGPMHIAAAVGTKTIGIFGPEPDDVWFTYSRDEGHLAIRKPVWCSPCRTTQCFREGEEYLDCMKQLSVKEIFEEVEKRLET